jgi:predicted Zn-dependent protease
MSAPKRLLLTDAERRAARVGSEVVLSRTDAQSLIERAIGFSRAESVRVTVDSSYQGNARFAANQMTTSGGVVNANVVVESAFGPKHAAVTTNDLSDEALRRTVQQSEVLARLAPDDPESMPPLGAQQYTSVSSWFDSTANLTAEARTQAALTALQPSRDARDLAAAGYIVTSAQSNAIGNKAGQFAYHRSTTANYTLTVRTADGTGSGWSGADDPDWSKINFAEVSKRAIDKARLSRNPVAIEPGRYTVILEPQAVADLVQLIVFYADARAADEGRSPFVKQGGGNKIGEKIVDSRITLISDPADPDLLAQPYDGDGLPLGRQVWIENGVLKQLYYSRFWAQKNNTTPTGFPSSVKMLGGTASIDDMIRSTPRGILVTRLWYLREVDPRTVLYTGLTRDGTFLIENGKVAKAIRNLRFNESPLFMLNNLEMIGRPIRIAGTEAGGAVVMPPIKVRDFNFTSLSEAV